MRIVFAVIVLALSAASVRSGDVKETKSALEADPKGWTDILPPPDLKGWMRVPIYGKKLPERNPWSVDTASKTLMCDGVGVHEMLLREKEMRDGIFHVEWRFQKIEPKDGKKVGYNSGVYVRNSRDGKIWHQAQVGNKNVGFIFGDTLIDGQLKRVRIDDKSPQRGKEAGEWNAYEITCKGKEMMLWINGAVTLRWGNCEVPAGHLGLEAEGYKIDFKNMKFKELK